MTYCKNYCEEEGISTSKLNDAQKTLFYIAENMRMARSISKEGYRHFQMAIKALERWIPVSEGLPEEYELNKAHAEKLATLMANHPDMRVIAWINTDGIDDDYCCVAGNIYEPHIETLIIGKDDMYHEKEDSPYDDCCHYYGWREVDEWTVEETEEKAKQIPWEDVIVVRVGVG